MSKHRTSNPPAGGAVVTHFAPVSPAQRTEPAAGYLEHVRRAARLGAPGTSVAARLLARFRWPLPARR